MHTHTQAHSRAPRTRACAPPVRSLFDALNRRDVSALLGLLAEGATYDSLAASVGVQGREAVARFYLDALSGLPEEAVFALDDTTDGGGTQVGIAWWACLGTNQRTAARGHPLTRVKPSMAPGIDHALAGRGC